MLFNLPLGTLFTSFVFLLHTSAKQISLKEILSLISFVKLRNCDPVRVQDIIIGEFRPGLVTSDRITSRLDKYFFMKIVGETQSSLLQVKQIELRNFL